MKTKLNIFICLLLLPGILLAQATKEKTSAIFVIKSDSFKNEVVTHALVMTFSNTKSFEIMNPIDVEKRFGNSKTTVVYVVNLNPNVKLISLDEFYKHQKITNGKQKGVIVDGQVIEDTSDILIDESSVKSVHVNNDNVHIVTLSQDKLHGFKKIGN